MILALSGFPLVIVSIIAFILILGMIILVHEGGHFFFAKRAGILCHEFSIGMGPAIWKKKYGETLLCIRAIPIGGYVSMADEVLVEGLVKKGKNISLNLIDGKVSEILVEEFEIAEDMVKPEANLFEDLDLDSIDAVDLAVKLQFFTDKKISPENFKQIRTVDDVVTAIEELLK